MTDYNPQPTRAYCPACGYDLTGLPHGHRCPDCGFLYRRGIDTARTAFAPFEPFAALIAIALGWLILGAWVGRCIYALVEDVRVLDYFGAREPLVVQFEAIVLLIFGLGLMAIYLRLTRPLFRSEIEVSRAGIRWKPSWRHPSQLVPWDLVRDVRLDEARSKITLHLAIGGDMIVPERFYRTSSRAARLHASVRQAWSAFAEKPGP